MKTFLAGALALLALQACTPAAPPAQASVSRVTGSAPQMPRGFVRTDGKGDIAVALAGTASCVPLTADEIAQALAATNAARASSGLPPMKVDPKAQLAAEKHACDMARRGLMTHIGSDTPGPSSRVKREGYKPRLVAENIAAGRMNLNQAVREWSASPDHRGNIMIPGVRDFGIGRGTAEDGRSHFWVAVYGQPQ